MDARRYQRQIQDLVKQLEVDSEKQDGDATPVTFDDVYAALTGFDRSSDEEEEREEGQGQGQGQAQGEQVGVGGAVLAANATGSDASLNNANQVNANADANADANAQRKQRKQPAGGLIAAARSASSQFATTGSARTRPSPESQEADDGQQQRQRQRRQQEESELQQEEVEDLTYSIMTSQAKINDYVTEVERQSQALLKKSNAQLNFGQLYSVFADGGESDAVPPEVLQLNELLLNTTSMATNSSFREAALQELWNQAVTPITEAYSQAAADAASAYFLNRNSSDRFGSNDSSYPVMIEGADGGVRFEAIDWSLVENVTKGGEKILNASFSRNRGNVERVLSRVGTSVVDAASLLGSGVAKGATKVGSFFRSSNSNSSDAAEEDNSGATASGAGAGGGAAAAISGRNKQRR
jgi:hypothetical protein